MGKSSAESIQYIYIYIVVKTGSRCQRYSEIHRTYIGTRHIMSRNIIRMEEKKPKLFIKRNVPPPTPSSSAGFWFLPVAPPGRLVHNQFCADNNNLIKIDRVFFFHHAVVGICVYVYVCTYRNTVAKSYIFSALIVWIHRQQDDTDRRRENDNNNNNNTCH